MKKLTIIPIKIWIIFFSFVLASILFLIFTLTYKIESTIRSSVYVKNWNDTTVSVDSMNIYKLKKDSLITIQVDSKRYTGVISEIKYNPKTHLFDLKIMNLNVDLIEDTTLPATIIYGEHKIFDEIFGSV